MLRKPNRAAGMRQFSCCNGLLRRRAVGGAGVLLSSATLVIIPKCPVCLATYVALATGISLPVATASHLRTVLLAGCVMLLLAILAKTSIKVFRARSVAKSNRPEP
jgi:hypothetical protein